MHCPYSFFLQYRKGIKDEAGPAAKLGIAVHAALHHAFNLHRQGRSFTIQELLCVVNESMLREGIPQETVYHFLSDAGTMLSGVDYQGLFNVEGTTAEVNNTFTRQPSDGSQPYKFKYIIDLLVETSQNERKAIIWDYKTDKSPVPDKHKLQLSIYRALLMEQRSVPTVGLFLYFLRHRRYMPITPISPDKVWALLDAVVANVRANNWTPKASEDNCNSPWPCGHRNACEYYKSRSKR